MVVCAVPGADAAAQVSGRELVARALPATPDGALDEDAAAAVLEDVSRFRALAIGPGLGRDHETQAAVRRIVAEADLAVVIDADALNAIAVDPVGVARTRRGRASARGAHAARGRVRAARGAAGGRRPGRGRARARRASARDRVAEGPGDRRSPRPTGDAVVNRTGGPALATAGTGDVLTGVIAGLLAQGVDAVRRGRDGRVRARAGGRRGAGPAPDIVASDLVSALPRTLQALRTGR